MSWHFVRYDMSRKYAVLKGELNPLVGVGTYLIVEKPECTPKPSFFLGHIFLNVFGMTPNILCGYDEDAGPDNALAVFLRIVEVNGEDGIEVVPVESRADSKTEKTVMLQNPTIRLPHYRRLASCVFIFDYLVSVKGEGWGVFDIQSAAIIPECGVGGEFDDIGKGVGGRRMDIQCGGWSEIVSGTDRHRLTIGRTKEGVFTVGNILRFVSVGICADYLPCSTPARKCYKAVDA